jgi:hypothetical protein
MNETSITYLFGGEIPAGYWLEQLSSVRAKVLGMLIVAAVLAAAGFYYFSSTGTIPQDLTIKAFVSTSVYEKSTRNIVLIGWDGAQRNHLKEMIYRGEVPNLMGLAAEGRLVDINVTTGATDTKAGWSQILTGYAPEKTGVYSNSRYQPIPEGYTVFERLEAFFGPGNIVTMAMIGKKGHVDDDGPEKILFDQWAQRERSIGYRVPAPKPGITVRDGGEIVRENGTFYVMFPGKPYFNAKNHMDMFLNGLNQNEKVAGVALENLEKNKDKRFFFFIHFAEPDHSGHAHGENSQQYTEGIESDDEWTGRIVAKLKQLGLYDQTLVYITADHGFDEGKTAHSNAPYVFLATNDPKINRNGDRADITPTILKRFGLDLSKMQPALDGIPLDEPAHAKVMGFRCVTSCEARTLSVEAHLICRVSSEYVPRPVFRQMSHSMIQSKCVARDHEYKLSCLVFVKVAE